MSIVIGTPDSSHKRQSYRAIEPYAGKLARAVLRKGGSRKASVLSGLKYSIDRG